MINPAKPDYTNTPVSPLRPRLRSISARETRRRAHRLTIVTPFFNVCLRHFLMKQSNPFFAS